MEFNTLVVTQKDQIIEVTFNREEEKNSINIELLQELNAVLDYAEANPNNKMVVLKGNSKYFCTGMDLSEYTKLLDSTKNEINQPELYINTIKRLSLIPRLIVAKVEGQVTAGGVGFVAASDYVIASENVQFSLSEALWGLLPCMVLPYLIRRVGFQKAYSMTLTTQAIDVKDAYNNHLVDCVSNNLDQELYRFWLRARLVDSDLIGQMKEYFRKIWITNKDDISVDTITSLMKNEKTQRNISQFVNEKKLPWE
jgi:polyketide biosynthesis enoyl-CoA hydratase PksH